MYTHRLHGAVGGLHTQALQGPQEVEGERVRLLMAADQHTYFDVPQDQSLSQHAVNP